MWRIYGFYTRNRNNGYGNILCIWVLEPLGSGWRAWFGFLPFLSDYQSQILYLQWPWKPNVLGPYGVWSVFARQVSEARFSDV